MDAGTIWAGEALGLARLAGEIDEHGAILVAHSEAQAARLAGAARALAGDAAPVHLPAWDCLPFDRASPSHATMGCRMASLRRIASGSRHLVIASAEALAQRVPAVLPDAVRLRTGDATGPDALNAMLARLGFVEADEAEAPGERASHPAVIDVFPADADAPVRIRFNDAGIEAIERIDARTRRGCGTLDALSFGPASELVPDDGEARAPGLEHRLAELCPTVTTVFEMMPRAVLLLDEDAEDSLGAYLEAVAEARETRLALARSGHAAAAPAGLHLDLADWARLRDAREVRRVRWPEIGSPRPDVGGDPARALRIVEDAASSGRRVGLSGRRLVASLDLDEAPQPFADWRTLRDAPGGTIAALPDGLTAGFDADGVLVLAEDEILSPATGETRAGELFAIPLALGDTVIHLDHGLGRLHGIETIETVETKDGETKDGETKDGEAGDGPTDCLAIDFADEARKLVPCAEMDRVWRHGSGEDAMPLDRADGASWAKRCGPVVREIERTAERLVAEAEARCRRTAPVIRPDRRRMARFVAGFPFTPTRDQRDAFEAIAADLEAGIPMDRLLCGDAGFGKTEAALRAAAAAALAGHQVAVLAPTTVLVRQHAETFGRRLRAIGVEVASLSRLTRPKDAKRVRERMADGSLPVVIGTQSLVAAETAFRDLGLVVIDEEQRFGTEDKRTLARMRDGVHTLTMTATPIPRTLARALAGLQEISILATPPARRLPVRTAVLDVDEAVLAIALRREHDRGGQSFLVCPRIKDLESVASMLHRLVPDLSVVVLHGRMKPDALDTALVGFADGDGDILLSTNIIEAGLDIPRANTLFAFDADRFGLTQLHQLRGRVGRGRARAHAFLFRSPRPSDGAEPPGQAGSRRKAASRLDALAAHDGLGAGFAISGRDLDQRGAGDLLGEEQAGHAKLLGLALARHLTTDAIRRARGEAVPEEWRPETSLSLPASIPADFIPDPTARIALHARLARPHRVAALAAELEDRFGPLPDEMRVLLAAAELRHACRRFGIARLEVGPSGVAADLRGGEAPKIAGLERTGRRLLLRRETATAAERIAAARHLIRLVARQARATRDAEPPRTANRRRAASPTAAPAMAASDQPPAA